MFTVQAGIQTGFCADPSFSLRIFAEKSSQEGSLTVLPDRIWLWIITMYQKQNALSAGIPTPVKICTDFLFVVAWSADEDDRRAIGRFERSRKTKKDLSQMPQTEAV